MLYLCRQRRVMIHLMSVLLCIPCCSSALSPEHPEPGSNRALFPDHVTGPTFFRRRDPWRDHGLDLTAYSFHQDHSEVQDESGRASSLAVSGMYFKGRLPKLVSTTAEASPLKPSMGKYLSCTISSVADSTNI
jgi:hypothetical protein